MKDAKNAKAGNSDSGAGVKSGLSEKSGFDGKSHAGVATSGDNQIPNKRKVEKAGKYSIK